MPGAEDRLVPTESNLKPQISNLGEFNFLRKNVISSSISMMHDEIKICPSTEVKHKTSVKMSSSVENCRIPQCSPRYMKLVSVICRLETAYHIMVQNSTELRPQSVDCTNIEDS